ncbi:50S ribosomal protein L10 [Thermoclostridium stercorarium subsp. stercorarium DSM 8532]|jgi:large subunit ribosomal protein L10|uniref:Large ribosomal subunit protein uL10 n=1 Tax=Thermoclostridium stercorarium (strain ATCC 35414 / DSM 8532 / NCIMB 11754) TaxID=1121335 RepID=L7VLC4_THES1|nr:50S ribosomal protein L10 [Thermoclostridium stercorarium subsp. stercorarium DSM 8532]AGI39959.1 ribosomal protein L10P [Thermoclostridium stercorarium subsp. stercorarium DSM 8532]
MSVVIQEIQRVFIYTLIAGSNIDKEVQQVPSEKVLNLKKAKVKELSEKMKAAKSFILADYRGLTVEQDTKMRREMRAAGVEYTVIKNSIIRFAAQENGYDLNQYLVGPTALAISLNDPVAPSKLLTKFAKEFEKLEIKAGVVEGKIVDINGIKAIASLPSKEELVAKVVGGLSGPLYGIVNVLNANIRGLVVALNAIAEKKQAEA